ncbi:MAG: type VI secretion system Vgr family protein [Planctomycetota bacterium]|jgi:type VI secretion system secreted protein VgrG
MALKQKNRMLGLKTPLGDDELVVIAFSGYEETSRLFRFELDMISDNNAVAASDLVGKSVTFSINLADGSTRYFNGFVNRLYAGDEDFDGRRNYRAEVVPWLWFLTRTSDCRIFQNKKVTEIIEQIFDDLGFSDYDTSQIRGDDAPRDYCTQYRETDFNFVARLMEEEGIFYFFKHEEGKHMLVLANQSGAYSDCVENEVDYPHDYGSRAVTDHITRWEHRWEFRTGKWAQTDYNFADHPARSEPTPASLLMSNQSTIVELDGVDRYEFYDYPGEYPKKDQGDAYTKIRMEEEEVEHDVVHAESRCRSFAPGGKMKIKTHRSQSEEGKKYVITSVRHSAHEPQAYETASQAGDDYANTFTCIPAPVAFRPERVTPKPVVLGLQPAVVTGPSGEEIWPDKYGRVKVQFFWDREGKRDENTSCWVRVSQTYGGKGWGSMCIPRIGQEVLVAFLEGDPNRPIITGRVYNADQMPPYGLPGSKCISGLKSNSSPGGGGYNEFIMDDTKGNELIREHGQFDKDSTIEHDLREHVLNDRSRDVTNNETITVGNDRTKSVTANETLNVGSNRTRSVGGSETVTVTLTRTHTVGINEAITVGAAQEITVGGLQAITVGAAQTITVAAVQSINVGASQSTSVGAGQTTKVGGNRSVSVGGNNSLSAGGDVSVSSGGKVSITAADEIVLKTGSASITMKSGGDISIQGSDIIIKGSGKINAKAGGNMVLKGSKIAEN